MHITLSQIPQIFVPLSFTKPPWNIKGLQVCFRIHIIRILMTFMNIVHLFVFIVIADAFFQKTQLWYWSCFVWLFSFNIHWQNVSCGVGMSSYNASQRPLSTRYSFICEQNDILAELRHVWSAPSRVLLIYVVRIEGFSQLWRVNWCPSSKVSHSGKVWFITLCRGLSSSGSHFV